MFIKPFISKYRESLGKSQYYLAKVADIKKVMSRAGINGDLHFGYPSYFDKKDIDKFPHHLRRGCEYGHDPVILGDKEYYYVGGKYMTRKRVLNLCKVYGLEVNN